MRIKVKYNPNTFPLQLSLIIFDAPHRRMHVKVIQQYRQSLLDAFVQAGIGFPLDVPVDLEVTFINPSSPDLGNLYLALEQAMDGATLKGPGILDDDSLISKVTMMKLFTEPKKK